jgi:hypothetical protein
MKKPTFNSRKASEQPAAQAADEAVLPQDGLTVTEVVEEAVVEDSTTNDPLPSVPVDEPPVVQAAQVAGGMQYLGTIAMDGMTGKGGSRRVCSLPVVVKTAVGHVLGVIVVGEPGDVTPQLADQLSKAGHAGGPFELVQGLYLDRATKLAAARAIAAQNEPGLDRHGALMALGYTAEQLA